MKAKTQFEPATFTQPHAFIGGQWVSAAGGHTIDVINPATGDIFGSVPALGFDETNQAIEAAKGALPHWGKLAASERAAVLKKWHALILEHQEQLAEILTGEQGKPHSEALGEISYGAKFVEWFAEEGKRAYGDIIP
ncbi:MAG: aldehyde dehydrogenase family protein, partial [Mesorhizobium sp.]